MRVVPSRTRDMIFRESQNSAEKVIISSSSDALQSLVRSHLTPQEIEQVDQTKYETHYN